jgi:hypothetical protein
VKGLRIRNMKMGAIIVAFLALQALNYSKPWPQKFDAPKAKWTELKTLSGYNYETNSYLIITDQRIRHNKVTEIAILAESVQRALVLFPLQLIYEGRPGNKKKHVVRIFEKKSEYIKSGAPKGTIGYFDGRSKEVKVSLEHLIATRNKVSNLQPRQRYQLLVHELIHQAMGDQFHALPTWLTEGIAEYFSALQYAPGRYRFSNCSKQIIEHLNVTWLNGAQPTVVIPSIQILTIMSAHTWAKDTRINEDNAYAKYAGALFLTHYQMELASRKLGGLRKFLENSAVNIHEHKTKSVRFIPADQAMLWKDKSFNKIESQICEYWKKRGLDLRFTGKFQTIEPINK